MSSSTPEYLLSVGSNSCGQLCHSSNGPRADLSTDDLTSVSLGGVHCAAVYSDGTVFGWGYNLDGRIGLKIDEKNEENNNIFVPMRIDGLPPIAKMKCGFDFTLFLSKGNEVFIATSKKDRRVLIEKISTNIKCVSVFGFKYPWIVGEDGVLYKMTSIDERNLMNMNQYRLPRTAKSIEIKTITSLYNVSTDICLTESGEIFGIGNVANKSREFVEIKSLKNLKIQKVSGIFDHIVALTDEGKVFVWGYNNNGQLGLKNKTNVFQDFVEIPKFSKFPIVDVSAGRCCSVFVDAGGSVWATGHGAYNQTLFRDEMDRLSPIRVTSIDKATSVSCGHFFTFVQIGGSPILDHFLNIIPKSPKPLHIQIPTTKKLSHISQNDETEEELKRLKEMNQQLIEKNQQLKEKNHRLKGEKDEIRYKYECLEKEKQKVDEINDKSKLRIRELEAIKNKRKEGTEVNDCSKFKEIKFLDEEALSSLKEVKTIGRGATSKVIEVVKEEKFALKIMTSEDDLDQNKLKHFLGEYEILNSLNHPNIIKAFGFSFNGGKEFGQESPKDILCPIILLEYCPFNLKKEVIVKMRKLEKIKILYEIVEGMISVHSNGIIHRDLKPENILIDWDGRIKISDFGISTLSSIKTHTKGIGTMNFMAPELFNDIEHYSEKIDNYAFGVLMYFILTNGEYPKITIAETIQGKKAPIPDSINSISKKIIKKCWSFSGEERPSFIEIKEEMEIHEFELISLSKEEKEEIKSIISRLY